MLVSSVQALHILDSIHTDENIRAVLSKFESDYLPQAAGKNFRKRYEYEWKRGDQAKTERTVIQNHPQFF